MSRISEYLADLMEGVRLFPEVAAKTIRIFPWFWTDKALGLAIEPHKPYDPVGDGRQAICPRDMVDWPCPKVLELLKMRDENRGDRW